MTHLLVTNDFPPKTGGIQSYLFELWSRLDPKRFTVLTHEDPGSTAFDRAQPFEIVRVKERMLLPTPRLAEHIRSLVARRGHEIVLLDPALPVGALGPRLGMPYGLVLHGAEVTVPGRLPLSRRLLARTLRSAALLVAAGDYPLAEARLAAGRTGESVVVPPGVDTGRFVPADGAGRLATRLRLGLPGEGPLVVSFSRLVPRKGMDVLIEASLRLREVHPGLTVVIGGTGRDEARLKALVERHKAPVRLLGRVPDEDLPGLLAAADVFAMLCRDRWLGLEQEGFGIVFLEAAACGVPQVAGRSGGSGDAVVDGVTGLVVDRPGDVVVAAAALDRLLGDAELRLRLGEQARHRAVEQFDYERLAQTLGDALAAHGG